MIGRKELLALWHAKVAHFKTLMGYMKYLETVQLLKYGLKKVHLYLEDV